MRWESEAQKKMMSNPRSGKLRLIFNGKPLKGLTCIYLSPFPTVRNRGLFENRGLLDYMETRDWAIWKPLSDSGILDRYAFDA